MTQGSFRDRVVIQYKRGQYRITSGKVMRYAAEYGEIQNTVGADNDPIDCYVGLFPESPTIFIINQFIDGKFDEHKVMLNFFDRSEAERAYSITTGHQPSSILACSVAQFEWWLEFGNHKKPISIQSLPFDSAESKAETEIMQLDWSNENMTAAKVIYDWRKTDNGEELLEPAVMDELILSELEDGAELETDAAVFDALVIQNKKLERTADILGQSLNRSSSGLKVAEEGVNISKPMKQNGVTNVAIMYELTDGQTISVFLHNPDASPQKLAPDDVLISWKWLLNKKDITIVVAKENGNDLPIQTVAKRVMMLAEKNVGRFAKANAARAERQANLQKMLEEIKAKEDELEYLYKQIEAKKNGATEPESASEPEGGNQSPNNLDIEKTKEILQRFSYLDSNAEEMWLKDLELDNLPDDYLHEIVSKAKKLEEFGTVTPHNAIINEIELNKVDAQSETAYLHYHNGEEEYFITNLNQNMSQYQAVVNVYNPETGKIEIGNWMFIKKLQLDYDWKPKPVSKLNDKSQNNSDDGNNENAEPEQKKENIQDTENNTNTETIKQYLQDVIDGKADFDGIQERLMGITSKYQNDEELLPLLEQAINAYMTETDKRSKESE